MSDERFLLWYFPGICGRSARPGRYTNTWWHSTIPRQALYVCIGRIVSDDIDNFLSTTRVHDVSYRVLGDSRVVPLIVLCLVTFSHLSRLCGFDFPLLLGLLRVSASPVSCWVLQLFRVTKVLMAFREKNVLVRLGFVWCCSILFGLWVLQLFRAKSSHDHLCGIIVSLAFWFQGLCDAHPFAFVSVVIQRSCSPRMVNWY